MKMIKWVVFLSVC